MIPRREAEKEDELMPSEAELELMAYLDGELTGAHAAEVEARLKSDPAFAAQLRALKALGDFVRDDSDRIFAGVDSIADDVMASLARESSEDQASPALELMALHDGEIEAGRRAEVEARVATDAACAGYVREIGAIGDFVRSDADRVYANAKVDSIADDVMAKLAQERQAAQVSEASNVISLQSRRQAAKPRKLAVVWVAFGSVAAAAAALFVYVQNAQPTVATVAISAPNREITVAKGIVPTPQSVQVNSAPIERAQVELEVEDVATPRCSRLKKAARVQ